ncbi:uncharacterized protein [Pagrus major]|uniref:uncharacterized protein n=1 Tax=Pagrus major TaxID=143350 RepID=UPI003CC8CF43
MRGGNHLLLLAVSVLLVRCQQIPQVSMSPELKEIFSGDLFYLSCDNSASGSTVKWYFNGNEQTVTKKTWRVACATPNHAGFYECESNGERSEKRQIDVHKYIPRASLTIKTGHPVMKNGSSVVLQLHNDDGLGEWNCWVYRGEQQKKIVLKKKHDTVSLDFQPKRLEVPETIFWCTDSALKLRSNQITVWTSDKEVLLEMNHLPAVAGDSLTLRCLAWGTDRITRATFYKNDTIIQESIVPTYTIPTVTESAKGRYKCDATFTYKDRTGGPPYHLASDNQEVFVQVASMKAVLSGNAGLSCSCPLCPSASSYHWYYNDNDDYGQPSHLLDSSQGFMMPTKSGTYACRAVWKTGMSFLSNSYVYKPPIKIIVVVLFVMLVILGAVIALAAYLWYKKRNATGPIYEDVALRTRDKGDDKYEVLHGAQRGGEYDTLHPEATGGERKGEYEPLKKEEMKEGVYHTLGEAGAAGGAGGYEALRKEGMKEGVYNTLGEEGAAGGAGGYEALRKEGMKEGVYNTLGEEGAAGGAGGYEALKKEGMKEGVYNTLGEEGAAGGAGGYEALKKEGMKGGEYHTLGGEGAGGGAGGYEALRKEGMKEGVYHTLGAKGGAGGE